MLHEFYRWLLVAKAALTEIDVRHHLLGCLYAAIWQQSQNGTPPLNPL